jgi:hypothetical protein
MEWPTSFNHLVGGEKELLGNLEPERLGGLEVDNQLELGRVLDGDVRGMGRVFRRPICSNRFLENRSTRV